MQDKRQEEQQSGSYSVAFQGEIGAYSQDAVYAFFGRSNVREVIPLPTFRRVFESLFRDDYEEKEGGRRKHSQRADYAVVPIENSLAGSVGEVLDLLLSSDIRIVGEVSIPILHVLVASRDTSIDQIRKVTSHPQAIAQCKMYLDSNNWEQIAAYDTAGAAKMIRDRNLKDTAAIASELASEIYGLNILKRNIQDDPSNLTRFIVIEPRPRTRKLPAKEEEEDSKTDHKYKTSLLFSIKHEPGSLVGALSAFSAHGINLTKIESRPIKSRPWEYYFFVDFEGCEEDENCKESLEELKKKTTELKILGSYHMHGS